MLWAAGGGFGQNGGSVSEKTLTFSEEEAFTNVQAVIVPGNEMALLGPFLPASAAGSKNIVTGNCAHADGMSCMATGSCSHAEGNATTASGMYAHAEGSTTEASGNYAHAEGMLTTASGDYSHAEGYATEATAPYSMIIGKYGSTNDDTLFAVANGTDETDAKLAFEVTSDAEIKVNGQLLINTQGKIATNWLPVQFISVVLSADGWTGTEAPYSQNVEADEVAQGMHGILVAAPTATAQQRAAIRSALLSITGMENGTITVTADGEKPSVDIPVCALIFGA